MSELGLLYPAFQKFYSALNNLDKFNKEKDFFENISSLDTFFSEFRNITFVLQKSLANTQYMSIYEKNRIKYLSECRWFVEKRNETTKQQPFQLVKQIDITIYFPKKSFIVTSMKFNVENDVNISLLIEKFKQLFKSTNSIEVFFSAEFSFFEKESSIDIWNELLSGIHIMQTFLQAMKEDINEPCELCEKLQQEINRFSIFYIPKDMLLINDYVYYPKDEKFERAGRISLVVAEQRKALYRMPLNILDKGFLEGKGDSYFEKFVLMHVIQQNTDLLSAIMIVYKDNTFELDAFNADIKTTIYRKINETAKLILTENVQEIYYMQTYVGCQFSPERISMTSSERMTHSQYELLIFVKIDCELNEEEYVFEGSRLTCMNYIAQQLRYGSKKKLEYSNKNMCPITEAFKKRQGIVVGKAESSIEDAT